jgi:hypothetical protein
MCIDVLEDETAKSTGVTRVTITFPRNVKKFVISAHYDQIILFDDENLRIFAF